MCHRFIVFSTALVLLAVLAASPPTLEAGGSLVVTRTDDPSPDGCAPADCSLREAVIEANDSPGHDTITLGPGSHTLAIAGDKEGFAATGDLDIRDDTTITGAGAATTIVDADGLDRIFDVGPVASLQLTVEISNMTIEGGDAGLDDGGGIRVWGSSGDMLYLTDAVLRNNSAKRGGGLVTGGGSGAALTNVVVMNNVAEAGGNSNAADGGGLYHCCSASGAFTLTRVNLHDNYAQGDGGGAFLCCSSDATLLDVAISSNEAGNDGGGLYHCCNDVRMDVSNSVIDTNVAGRDGGGIFTCCAGLAVNLTNVTVSGNQAVGDGGGVYNASNATGSVNILNATITANQAVAGSGVFNDQPNGVVYITNTIIAGNIGDDCEGPLTSVGHNIDSDSTCDLAGSGDISGVDPLLGPLADNGGPTRTHALLDGSPAIDKGSNTDCPDTDQRGVGRPQNLLCDIGAFELGGNVAATPTPTPSPSPGGSPTPTPTPTASATPTPTSTGTPPTPTPTGTPQAGPAWGDGDCSGGVAATDALKHLQYIASIPYTVQPGCPALGDIVQVSPAESGEYLWGDVDCNGALAATDALAILRHIAALSVNQQPGCPEIGDSVLVQS